jgi:hypothetical protein
MAMKKTPFGHIGLIILVFLTGCYPGTIEEVVNNAGQSLTVVSMDTELKETAYPSVSNQTVRIKVPYKLRIECGGEVWNYNLPPAPLPDTFRKRVRGNRYLEKFQIEKDGTIYARLPDSQGPATRLPPQPVGYPLRPK